MSTDYDDNEEGRIVGAGLYIEVSGAAVVEQLQKSLDVLQKAHTRLLEVQKHAPVNTSSGIYIRKLRVDIEARIAHLDFMAKHTPPTNIFVLDRNEVAFLTGTVIDIEGLEEGTLNPLNPTTFAMPPVKE